jgi:hypothetical protein
MAAYGFGYETFAVEDLTGEKWIAADSRELIGVIERFTAASA